MAIGQDWPVYSVEIPEAPDFNNTEGFQVLKPSLGWNSNEAESFESIDFLSQGKNYFFRYLVDDGWSSVRTSQYLFEISNSEADCEDGNIRIRQDLGLTDKLDAAFTNQTTVYVKNRGKLSLNNVGDFHIFAEGNRRIFCVNDSSFLGLSASNIWLRNDNYRDQGASILDSKPKGSVEFDVGDFITNFDIVISNDADSALFDAGKMSLKANNFLILVNNKDRHNVNLTAFEFNNETSIGVENKWVENFYIDGAQTGITIVPEYMSKVDFYASNLILKLDNEVGRGNGVGIDSGDYSDVSLNFYSDLVLIEGAATGLKFKNAHTTIDMGDVDRNYGGLFIDLDFESESQKVKTGIDLDGNVFDLKAPVVYIRNATSAISMKNRSCLISKSGGVILENGDLIDEAQAIAIENSDMFLSSNSLLLRGWGTGLYVNGVASERFSSDIRLVVKDDFSIADSKQGIVAEGGNIHIEAGSLKMEANHSHDLINLSLDANLNLISRSSAVIVGDISIDNAKFYLSAGASSYIRGGIANKNGEASLVLGEGGRWEITSQSDLTLLDAKDSHIVFSNKDSTDRADLSIKNLSGSGNTFVLASTPDLSSVSFIDIGDASAAGEHLVQLGENLSLGVDGDVEVLFASDASGNVRFMPSSSLSNAGLFVVSPDLESKTNLDGSNDWYITNIRTTPAPTPVSMIDGYQNNYFFWRTLTDSTRERFGQLRHGESVGVWGRATAGSLSYGSIQNSYQTYRLGADASVNADWKVGIMAERHEGKLEASTGRGDMNATTASIYALYVGDSGFYADGGLRFGIMDYEYTNRSLLPDSYDYQSSAFGGWLEVGHEWEVAGGWTVSPHAAFSYGRFSAEDFTTANGLKASADSVDSGIFTLGADFGFKLDGLELFFTADAKHEALGDQKISVSHEGSSIRQSVDYSDTWAEYGINLSYRPSDQSLVWLNVRRSSFADVEQDWKINLGARWLLD